jgi:hypothetical protein
MIGEIKMSRARRIERIIESAKNSTKYPSKGYSLDDIIINYKGYSEPGYEMTHEDGVILTADWNDVNDKVVELLERAGADIEWCDEWTSCCDCGKLVRTIQDSYSWQPYYNAKDCELVCGDCVDPEEHLKSLEVELPIDCRPNCNTLTHINPEDYGYSKVGGDYESGLHEYMTDDPVKVAERLHENGHKRILFNLDLSSQFHCGWSVYVMEEVA